MPKSTNILTQYMRINEERKKLQRQEERLKEVIKTALEKGETVKNRTHKAVLIDVENRSISNEDFIETFDYARFAAAAEISVTKVDALVKLGVVKEQDVKSITHITPTKRIGLETL